MRRRTLLTGAVAAGVATTATTGTAATAAGAAPATEVPRQPVMTGLEALEADGWAALAGQRVGMISNPTGVNRDYVHAVDLMHADERVDIVAVFGPEHGFRGSAQAGGSEGEGIDERTGLTVYDAYGANETKFATMFTRAEVQTVVFDIQDVGARFYTYIWTMYRSMIAAARLGLRYVVLDRPNPIGGEAYGPMMTPAYTSGVGVREIVLQHGMTVGELARFFNAEFLAREGGAVDLEVVWAKGWRRDVLFGDIDVPWVLPSPNMPTPDTALVYPGTAMFEGVANIAEGRGTTRPFELIGGPSMDYHWGDRINARNLPGVRFREAYFKPLSGGNKFPNQLCNGVEVKVTDRYAYDPIRTAVAMLVDAKVDPDFAWRQDAWDTRRPYWIDKLTGSTRLREQIDAGADVDEVVGAWAGELADFRARRKPYLHYVGPVSP
ncbi:MAG: exo-beta-N-acetylmuramidase NamZ family protein [Micromonosporaceae bacterium]